MASSITLVRLLHNAAIMNHQPQARITPGSTNHRHGGIGIVTITADIKAQLRLRPGIQHMRDSGPDNAVFLPCRDQHRDRCRQRCIPQFCAIHTRRECAARELQPEVMEVKQDIVQGTDQEEQAREQ